MELDLNKKVPVKNLTALDCYFPRSDARGDIKIVRNANALISREEIQNQVYQGNKMFVGFDGIGSHAMLFIEDKDTRVLVGFEEDDKTQFVLNAEEMDKILSIRKYEDFTKEVQSKILSDIEKQTFADFATKKGLNDHKKISFIEEYTGIKFVVDEK